GAQFRHYNGARYFHEQLESLDPDLVIVSLGTNEANSGFQTNTFFRDMDTFIHDLETHLPHANILITTPADALKARRYPNAAVGEARNLILDYTMNNGLSCWDFYEVMGGFKSIQDWHKAGLAQQDRLHLTRRGYELQAELLYEALMSEYERFATLR
ncbi:MAG: GDSL-type esterase/lipase family protein, partial [Bacteroidota bacterium]